MLSIRKRDIRRFQTLSPRQSITVAALDIGSTKICCMVARLHAGGAGSILPGRTHRIEILGYGHHVSQGICGGKVTDLSRAERAIRAAVDGAEHRAGVVIDVVIANASCGDQESLLLSASARIADRQVAPVDINRALEAIVGHARESGTEILHALPMQYTIDSEGGIREPLGLIGDSLAVDTHVIRGSSAPLHNLIQLIERSHLRVTSLVNSAYASALATLVEDDAELGTTCVDLGGGVTSFGVFANGQLVHVDAIPVGAHHLTLDIARELSLPVADAERLKTLFGSACQNGTDADELIPSALLPETSDARQPMTRAHVTRIIEPRITEIFESLRDRLRATRHTRHTARQILLTGGGSQLPGVADACERITGITTHNRRPLGVQKLPRSARGPAFSTVVGLLVYPQVLKSLHFQPMGIRARPLTTKSGRFYRMGRWIRESF